jgi:hypothetical protein
MKCFVLMPFSREFDDVYSVIRLALRSVDVREALEIRRLDEIRAQRMPSLAFEIKELRVIRCDGGALGFSFHQPSQALFAKRFTGLKNADQQLLRYCPKRKSIAIDKSLVKKDVTQISLPLRV